MSEVTAPSRPHRSLPIDGHAAPTTPLLNPILGREAEIDRVVGLLDHDDLRLVTLLGPGGVGKTRLAREVMRQAGDDFAHGARFVSLAPVREPALVPFAVAQSLGIQERGALPVPELLASWLHPRHLLLVLDNMEQVIDAAAPWLVDLLASCPRLKILVTSRTPLDISGEQRFRVPPLPIPGPHVTDRLDAYASVALFMQRARAVHPDVDLSADFRGTIAEICTRLDGLPLAIELAAARTNVFSPAELLARLTDRLTLLIGGHRDAPPRLRSLRDAIGWSYDLLATDERELFCRLAVFVGAFSLDAAEFVAARAPGHANANDTLQTIATLIDHSLVERVDDPSGTRYRMLETIREFGLAHLAERDALDAARDAHAAFYQRLASEAEPGLKGPDQATWLNLLEVEYANLREAMRWLTARDRVPDAVELFSNIFGFMRVRAHFTDGRQLMEGWLATPDLGQRTRTRALVLIGIGLMSATLGEVGAQAALDEALDLFRELEDRTYIIHALNSLTYVSWIAGDANRARMAHNECMALVSQFGDARCEAAALFNGAFIDWWEGETERARQGLEAALTIARRAGDQGVIAMVLGELGQNALFDEDSGRAHKLIDESRTILEGLGDKRDLPVAHINLALIARAQGDFETARTHLDACLSIAQETGQVIHEGIAHFDLSVIARLQRDLVGSMRELRLALRLFPQIQHLPDVAECLDAVAALALAAGDAAAAARFLGGADWLVRDIGLPRAMLWPFGEHDWLPARVRAELGDDAFERAYAGGAGWSVGDAIAAALAFELPAALTERAGNGKPTHGLSPRELEVLRLMTDGSSNQQIADALYVSRRTITSHVSSILGKLDLATRTQAVSFAIRSGIA